MKKTIKSKNSLIDKKQHKGLEQVLDLEISKGLESLPAEEPAENNIDIIIEAGNRGLVYKN